MELLQYMHVLGLGLTRSEARYLPWMTPHLILNWTVYTHAEILPSVYTILIECNILLYSFYKKWALPPLYLLSLMTRSHSEGYTVYINLVQY